MNWVQSIVSQRPKLKFTFDGKGFERLIATGTAVTIIRGQDWPSNWLFTNTQIIMSYMFFFSSRVRKCLRTLYSIPNSNELMFLLRKVTLYL